MSVSDMTASIDELLKPGSRCLLVLMGKRFLVSVLHTSATEIRVSFPIQDFPIAGMRVDLEFHGDRGYAHCETEVLEATGEIGEGLLLKRPAASLWNQHRTSWRVPVSLKATYKSHVHPRRVEAEVINLSAGGLLLLTTHALEHGENVDIELNLGGRAMALLGQVAHVAAPQESGEVPVGIRFISTDAVDREQISNYVWRRLREVYGADPGAGAFA
ncbi:MAG: PilZ domain-containing protein [Candidatus Competibacteraceae bacterium]|nr:PilZ domain-containing protein [Candidatus Competibacteraceae bacterium]